MNDNTNPASKSAQPQVPDCPFLCPHCNQPAKDIMVSSVGTMLVIYHLECKKILNCQVIAVPRQAQPLIAVPGRPS